MLLGLKAAGVELAAAVVGGASVNAASLVVA